MKKNILTLVLSEKKFLNEIKNHNPPPFKLNGRSLIRSKCRIHKHERSNKIKFCMGSQSQIFLLHPMIILGRQHRPVLYLFLSSWSILLCFFYIQNKFSSSLAFRFLQFRHFFSSGDEMGTTFTYLCVDQIRLSIPC